MRKSSDSISPDFECNNSNEVPDPTVWGAIKYQAGEHQDILPLTIIPIADFNDEGSDEEKDNTPDKLGEGHYILSYPNKTAPEDVATILKIFKGKPVKRDGFAPGWNMLVLKKDSGFTDQEIIATCDGIDHFPFSPFSSTYFSSTYWKTLFALWVDPGKVNNFSFLEIRLALRWLGGGFLLPAPDNAIIVAPYNPNTLNAQSFVNLISSGKAEIELRIVAVVGYNLDKNIFAIQWITNKPVPLWGRGEGGLNMEPVLIIGFDPLWTEEKISTHLLALGCPDSRLKDAKWAYPRDQKKDNRVLVLASIQDGNNKAITGKMKVNNTYFHIFLHSKINRKVRIGPPIIDPTDVNAQPDSVADFDAGDIKFSKAKLSKGQAARLEKMERSLAAATDSSSSSSSSSSLPPSSLPLFPSFLFSPVTINTHPVDVAMGDGGGSLAGWGASPGIRKRVDLTPHSTPTKVDTKKAKPGSATKSALKAVGSGRSNFTPSRINFK